MAVILLKDEMAVVLKSEKPLKRKRIRQLGQGEPFEGNLRKRYCRRVKTENQSSTVKRYSRNYLITCLLISGVTALLLGNYFSQDGLFSKLISNYWRNYHQIAHGNKNYCDESLDVDALSSDIRKDQTILHQNKALQELQSALKYNRNIISIALIGPVGVGKNLYANALQKHFPWPQNIQSYVWNTFVRHKSEKIRNVYMLMDQFSDCGINLLIIRNLTPTDKEIVDNLMNMIKTSHILRRKRIIILFIFNLNTMINDLTQYSSQIKLLQNLNYTTSINFQSFGKEELRDCIKRELLLENMTLSHTTFEELLNTIDVKRSGCKNVKAKVLSFGTKLSQHKISNAEAESFEAK